MKGNMTNWRVLGVRAACAAWVALCAVTVTAQEQPDDIRKLQGGWLVVAAEQRGKPFEAIKGGALVIEGATFFLRTAAGSEFRGEIRVDPARSPRQIDFVHEKNGPVWEAIYSVNDEMLRLNYVEAGERNPRPTLFATSADTAGTVIVMNRMAQRPQ